MLVRYRGALSRAALALVLLAYLDTLAFSAQAFAR
jgi:hypothetical protein